MVHLLNANRPRIVQFDSRVREELVQAQNALPDGSTRIATQWRSSHTKLPDRSTFVHLGSF